MSPPASAEEVLAWLARRGSRRNVDGMARYGIRSASAFGVSMAAMRPLVERLRPDHALAAALWASGWHEARICAALIDDPARVTRAQMDAWALAFDNWAVCDTTCLHLFRRAPRAWAPIPRWARSRQVFVRRAAFAQIAGLAVHDRSPDARFLALLPILRRASRDDEAIVRKAVSWALRTIGQRSLRLHGVVRRLAAGLRAADHTGAQWIGRDVERDLARPIVRQRAQRRASRAGLVSSRG
jgi:3-methyladenine DNA glycosylase AlkD